MERERRERIRKEEACIAASSNLLERLWFLFPAGLLLLSTLRIRRYDSEQHLIIGKHYIIEADTQYYLGHTS